MQPELDLTIIIPTRNRAESLGETLGCLERADRSGISFEVVVVDNGSDDNTADVVRRFSTSLPVSYYFEPQSGKSHALNRGIKEAQLGALVAVLDDDMSPDPDWLQGVMAISRRWPRHGYFAGLSYIIWPDVSIPAWARTGLINGWAFSVTGTSLSKDRKEKRGDFVSGNHFWFRSSVLKDVSLFTPVWLTEPYFVLELQRCGHDGVTGVDAVSGHRIQPELLQIPVQRKRAFQFGYGCAELKMRYSDLSRWGQLFHRHPLLFFVACIGSLGYWCCAYVLATCNPSSAKRIAGRLRALTIIYDRAGLLRFWTHARD